MILKKKIIFLFTHPIQYFSPLIESISKDDAFDIEVIYCEDTTSGYFDTQFGKYVKWDTPLLNGYNYTFLPNSFLSKLGGFFKHSNFSIVKSLYKKRPNILVVHGWNFLTAIIAILISPTLGIKVWHRGESPLKQELLKPNWLLAIKKIYLRFFLFKFIDKFLYIGSQNKAFYQYHHIQKSNLIFTPYCVNNQFFQEVRSSLPPKKELRQQLGIDSNKKVILTVGKLIPKKNPFALLEAFKQLNRSDTLLVYVGDGHLRTDMEYFIKVNQLPNVLITGFKNQTELPHYYAAADIFVLPSIEGETWGLVNNEAMNFGLPIVCSTTVGSSDDLVINDVNGYTFDYKDINKLSEILKKLLDSNTLREQMGNNSEHIIEKYSYHQIIENIKKEIK